MAGAKMGAKMAFMAAWVFLGALWNAAKGGFLALTYDKARFRGCFGGHDKGRGGQAGISEGRLGEKKCVKNGLLRPFSGIGR